ncbi:MAG: peptidylprolyl isomerase [Saprospiraceae bacterium]|nr:peptidylprolyl isomerase [Saprospiraceae bacterium]
MALIGTIRKNSWILVVMVGLGLGGFILMDVSSAGGPGGNNQFTVGEVNGDPIDWIEFQRAEQALYQNSAIDVYNRRDYLWNYFIEEALVRKEAELNGLTVGETEMQELQFGANLSPVVRRNFSDPTTQQVNRQSLNEFKAAADAGTLAPQFQLIWDFQQEEIVKERLQSKLMAMVQKAIYTPTWMAEEYQKDVGASIDFKYVLIPFDAVDDSEITVTEADYSKYINENRALYERREESRDAKYVVFDVLPTPEDSADLRKKIADLVEPFADAENDSLFAENNFGTYDVVYYKQADLPEALADTLFDLEPGTVYGPYIDNGAYKAAKVIDKKVIADSVRARHILISVTAQEQVMGAMARADSIMNLIETGAEPFDSLAMKLSNDGGSAVNGGDLGFVAPGTFVKPMNDLIFYQDTEEGEVYRVNTQFGIHLVEVMERKFDGNEPSIQYATIEEAIVPSEATQDYMYDDVLEFAGLNRTVSALTASVEADDDLVLEEARDLARNAFSFGNLGTGNTSRDIIRWMFDPETKVGAVAPEVFIFEDPVNYFNARYVVVGLDAVHPKGLAKPPSVMHLIEGPVKNRKKGEKIVSQINSTTLTGVAQQFDVEIDSVENVHLGIEFMRNIGNEPKVLGTAYGLPQGQVSAPIIGENGVYVIEVVRKADAPVAQNIPDLRRQAISTFLQAMQFEMMPALREHAKIKDNRYTYF